MTLVPEPDTDAPTEYSIPRIGGDGRFPLLEPFRYRAWVRVWFAALFSQLGDWM
jgi:hypothetical protein